MRRAFLPFVVLVSACGASRGRAPESTSRVSEPASSATEPSPAASAVAPVSESPPASPNEASPTTLAIEHLRVERGSTASVAGVMHTFSEFSADGAVDAVGFVGLTDPSGAVVRAPTHGCVRTRGANVRVVSVTPGPPVAAELAVATGDGSERAVSWLETVDLAIGNRLTSPDGFVVRVTTIRERLGALVWDLEAHAPDGTAEAIAGSQGGTLFGGDRLVSVEPSDRRDALGCPIARATLERPSLVLPAVDGAEIRIRRGSGARLGNLTVRFVGVGERRTRRGDIALVTLSITLGSQTEERIAHFDETLELEGYAIDVIDAGPYARVRLRVR